MTIEFTIRAMIPAPPQIVYDAWLDSEQHSKMTGSPAHASSEVDQPFDAWDGFISGRNLELDPGKRIVQSWRARDYLEGDGDSRIEVTFDQVPGGTKVTLIHTNIPDNQTTHQQGWHTHYFEPMTKYFAGLK